MYADGCTGELNFGYVVGRLIDFGLSEISGYHSCGCEDVTKGEDSFSQPCRRRSITNLKYGLHICCNDTYSIRLYQITDTFCDFEGGT